MFARAPWSARRARKVENIGLVIRVIPTRLAELCRQGQKLLLCASQSLKNKFSASCTFPLPKMICSMYEYEEVGSSFFLPRIRMNYDTHAHGLTHIELGAVHTYFNPQPRLYTYHSRTQPTGRYQGAAVSRSSRAAVA